jgi:uncharacterized protein (TIGR03437 family)
MRLLTLLFASLLASAQTLPPLVDIATAPPGLEEFRPTLTQMDSRGDIYFAGILPAGGRAAGATAIGPVGSDDILVMKIDPSLNHVIFAAVIGGGSPEQLQAFSVDAAGNVFLAGTTESSDFPFTARLDAATAAKVFVIKLNASGKSLDYALALNPPATRPLTVGAIQAAADGSVWVGGDAEPRGLPTTPGAYHPAPYVPFPYLDYDGVRLAYVLKVVPQGNALQVATYLSTRSEAVEGLVARADGGVTYLTGGAIGALNASASDLLFETKLGNPGQVQYLAYGASLAAADAANYWVSRISTAGQSNYLEKYSPQGELLKTIDLGKGLQPAGLSTSSDGRAFLAGNVVRMALDVRNTLEPCAANLAPPLGTAGSTNTGDNGIAVVSPDGTIIYEGFSSMGFGNRGPYSAATSSGAIAVTPDGRYVYGAGYLRSGWKGAARMDLSRIPTGPRMMPVCLANAASYGWAPVVPGEMMTLYGSGLGPATGQSFQLRDGMVPTDLAGTRVLVDGQPSPILYAGDSQVNFIVPWQTKTGGVLKVCVERGGERKCIDSGAAPTSLGIFSSNGLPIVALQNGSLNTASNPVPRGGYVTLYLTGTGQLDSMPPDGSVSGFPLQHVYARLQVYGVPPVSCPPPHACDAFVPGPPVVYAGSAPGMVSGVTQVNLFVPPDRANGALNLRITDSNGGEAYFVIFIGQ